MIKTLRFIALSLTITIITLLLLFKLSNKLIIDETDIDEILIEIDNKENLPINFINFYQKIYPNSLEDNFMTFSLKNLITNRYESKCPCFSLSQHLSIFLPNKKIYKRRIDLIKLIFELENRYGQEKCLNLLFKITEFDHNTIGIDKASIKYFNKKLSQLTNNEMIELILRSMAPSRYKIDPNWGLFEIKRKKLREK